MKHIIVKTVVLVNGAQIELRESDFSQSVYDFECDMGEEMTPNDIINHVLEDAR